MSDSHALGSAGPWTVDDLRRLPDDGLRYEIVDGALVVTPAPSPWHQSVGARLLVQLATQAPAQWAVGYEMTLTVGGGTRVVDLVLVRGDVPVPRGSSDYLPDHFGLVVEIVSPSSRSTDRVLKPLEYAAAGIPFYWRVEIEPLVQIHACTLVGGHYVEDLILSSGRMSLPGPCPLVVDLDDLARP